MSELDVRFKKYVSSTKTSDQAELIYQILNTLPNADRAMIVDVVQRIAERLKHHL